MTNAIKTFLFYKRISLRTYHPNNLRITNNVTKSLESKNAFEPVIYIYQNHVFHKDHL